VTPAGRSHVSSVLASRYRDKYPEMRLDEMTVLIQDAYPKAQQHALVMPRCESLDDVTALTAEHLPLLERMKVKLYLARFQLLLTSAVSLVLTHRACAGSSFSVGEGASPPIRVPDGLSFASIYAPSPLACDKQGRAFMCSRAQLKASLACFFQCGSPC
jgi:hypothetical protein